MDGSNGERTVITGITFTGNCHAVASNNGSRYVFRYNDVHDNAETFQPIDAHEF